MKTIVLILVISLTCVSVAISQHTEIIGDTIEISLEGYQTGEIQWQFSTDKKDWKNLPGANLEILNHIIAESGFLRAKVTTGTCSFYSDTTSINAFNFDYRDENRTPKISKDSEYLVIIPDIQMYIAIPSYNKYLENIIDWILNFNHTGFKVKAVLQVGDITDRNSIGEWEKAKEIFSKLDNKIDYILCTGNHDYGDNGTVNNRNTHFNEYFNYTSGALIFNILL